MRHDFNETEKICDGRTEITAQIRIANISNA